MKIKNKKNLILWLGKYSIYYFHVLDLSMSEKVNGAHFSYLS
jgi:hypothetical protein